MRKIILLIFIVLFNFFESQSQNDITITCATDELHAKNLQSSTAYKRNFEDTKELWSQYAMKYNGDITSSNKTTPSITTLSLVFHDLSAADPGTFIPSATTSIDDYQYIIDNLNTVYSGTNLNGVAGNDTFIRFCLARQDVNGDDYALSDVQVPNVPEADGVSSGDLPAIIALTEAAETDTKFPTNKFINVYIVDNIAGSAGFATLPSSHGNVIDGIYLDRSFLIDNATINNNIVVITHEIGHYLGLIHTFGICDPGSVVEQNCSCDNDNCLFNGDMVCDTPPNIMQQTYTTPPNTCSDIPFPSISDGSHPLMEEDDQKENYMDYGYFNDKFLFTAGQITRMCFMLDPDFGPRKSILNTAICVDCVAMDGCNFSIDHNLTDNITVANTTETFTASISDCEAGNPNVNYTWQLTNLTTGVGAGNFTGQTVNITPSAFGNYELSLLVSLASNNQCFEEVEYNFQVVPDPSVSPCLQFPSDDANWNGWNQVSYQGGWALDPAFSGVWDPSSANPSDYAHPTTVRNTDAASVDPNFEVVNDLSADPNFSTYTLPANVPNFIRVGAPIDGNATLNDGAGNYVSMTFHPTPENSRYRVHFVGATANLSNFSKAPNVFFNDANYPSTFGWFSRYEYDSPLDPSAENNDIGSYENNASDYVNRFPQNDFIMGNTSARYVNRRNVSVIPQQNIAGVQYKVMADWDSIELDFSEFVNDPNSSIDDNLSATDITITFFARTNNAAGANLHAYAYFGIECLGGGLPEHVTLEMDDLVISCQSETDDSCITTDNILANYIGLMPYSHYTSSIEESLDGITFGPTTDANLNYLYNGSIGLNGFNYVICLDENDPPSKYYRITLNTMHQSVQEIFQVFKGYFYNDPVCDENSTNINIAGDIEGDSLLFMCDGDPDLTLSLTTPCFEDTNYNYIWWVNGTTVQVGNNPTLDFSSSDLRLALCRNWVRRDVVYTDPYCETPTIFSSDLFTIYNLNEYQVGISDPEPLEDACFGEPINIAIHGTLAVDNCDNAEFSEYIQTEGLDTMPGSISYTLEIDGTSIETITVAYPNGIYSTPADVNFSTINNLAVGDHTISYTATSNFNGCSNSDVYVGGIYDTSINVAPISIGGEINILDNCAPVNIISITDGASNNDIYEWEYSYTSDFSGTVNTIVGATGTTINDLDTIVFTSYPVYIRRVSNPFPNSEECEDNTVKYSNVTILENCSDCPDCSDLSSQVIVQQSRICGSYQIFVSTGYSDCYRFILLNNGVQTTLPEGVSAFSYTENGSYTIDIIVENIETGAQCDSRSINLLVNCFDDCPKCEPRQSAIVQNNLWSTFEENERACGQYSFKVPELEACYEILIDWGDGQTETVSNADTGSIITHQYASNNDYAICTQVFVDGERCGRRRCTLVRVDCLDNCPDCEAAFAVVAASITPNEDCSKFTVEVPEEFFECYSFQIVVGSDEIDISAGQMTIETNGFDEITLYVYSINDLSEPCLKEAVLLNCCKACDPRQSAVIQNSLWISFTDNANECGQYAFDVPQLDPCYEILINWGDGQSDIVSNANSGSVITHQYTTDGAFGICAQVLVDGKECGRKQCKDVAVNCAQDPSSEYFITTWDTTLPGVSNSTSITIPTRPIFVYNYDVDWESDGIFDEFGLTGNVTHDYEIAGNYTVSIRGDFPQIYFFNQGDKEKIISVDHWGPQIWKSMRFSFNGCSNIHINALDDPDLSTVSFMHSMFKGAAVMNEDIGSWNVSNVKNMQFMFSNASSFNQNISSWNVSNVEDMSNMFYVATDFNQNIGNWDTSNVKNMRYMFGYAALFNQDVSGWNTELVTDMQAMFFKATSFNQNIGSWNVENLTDAAHMFLEVTLSVDNYDALLIGWNSQNLVPDVLFHGGFSTYCVGESARTNMINTDNWSITDNGLDASCPGFSFSSDDNEKLAVIDNKLSLFPNPADKEITIKFDTSLEASYILFVRDMIGSIIYQAHNESKVNVSNLPDGVYFMELRTSDGELYRKQFIVKR